MEKVVRVGVGVFVFNDKNQFLMGKRKASIGEGFYALPGGHLEMFEKIEACSIREVKEETGLDITDIKINSFYNDIFEKQGKHYLTIYVFSRVKGEQSPKLIEPEKCDGWQWFDVIDGFKQNLFFSYAKAVKLSDIESYIDI